MARVESQHRALGRRTTGAVEEQRIEILRELLSELGTGKSRLEVLESLGLKNLQLAPLHRLKDGINAVRVFLPKCWFDAEKCAPGIDALKLYRAQYDDKLQALRPRPVHDWTSHAADSFRYLALTFDRRATHSGFYRRIDYPQHGVV